MISTSTSAGGPRAGIVPYGSSGPNLPGGSPS